MSLKRWEAAAREVIETESKKILGLGPDQTSTAEEMAQKKLAAATGISFEPWVH